MNFFCGRLKVCNENRKYIIEHRVVQGKSSVNKLKHTIVQSNKLKHFGMRSGVLL